MNDKIGKFIKELRTEKNISQGQLGEILNIDRTVINKWENSKLKPTSDSLEFLAKYFKVSVDELLAGERKNEQNKEHIDRIKLITYDEQNEELHKSHVILKITIAGLIASIILFLSYYFVSNYKAFKLYKITTSDEKIEIENSTFFKTPDEIFFEMKINYKMDDIEKVALLYNDEVIVETTDINKVGFRDFYGYQEYIDFENLKNIKDGFSMQITQTNNEIHTVKLKLIEEYNNSSFFNKKRKKISNGNNKQELEDNSYIKQLKEKIAINTKKEVKLNGGKYTLMFFDKYIKIEYKIDNVDYEISYMAYVNEVIEKSKYKNGEENTTLYSYDMTNKKCDKGNCENYKIDLELLKNIIESL